MHKMYVYVYTYTHINIYTNIHMYFIEVLGFSVDGMLYIYNEYLYIYNIY